MNESGTLEMEMGNEGKDGLRWKRKKKEKGKRKEKGKEKGKRKEKRKEKGKKIYNIQYICV